uniref:Zinc finger protein RFP-like n=1 Tax=Pelusios castaneus TaxID=367368 RepID=A0A8C8VJJ7_9SAUR
MAAANPAKTLQEETTCPICLEYFKDPVLLDCDHIFCRVCITLCCDESQTVSCPQCRHTCLLTNLRAIKQLRSIVEAVRGLRFQSLREAETERLCEIHRNPLKLFCKEDEIPICLVCDRSKKHRKHTLIPAEVAASDYKQKIQPHLKRLREEREKLLDCKVSREKRNQENLRKTQTEMQKIVSEFQQLRQFLGEQEQLLLVQLEKVEENVKIETENITKLSEEISRLSELISEVEGKSQKPDTEFLQDVRSMLSRCKRGKFQQPEEIFPGLEKGLSDVSQKTVAVVEAVRTFKDTVLPALEEKLQISLGSFTQVTVTLDPDTAHPDLVLFEDGKSVIREDCCYPFSFLRRYRQPVPNPDRFDTVRCVLGREGFTWGRHYWEVEVGGGEGWAVGVARESVGRKGRISHSPEGGIWAVWRWEDQFWALTSPWTPLPHCRAPSRIQVCLDCDRGQVTFFGAGDEAPIFTFPPGSVPGERIRPWLWVWDPHTRLRLCP